jgi:hypothetical protein
MGSIPFKSGPESGNLVTPKRYKTAKMALEREMASPSVSSAISARFCGGEGVDVMMRNLRGTTNCGLRLLYELPVHLQRLPRAQTIFSFNYGLALLYSMYAPLKYVIWSRLALGVVCGLSLETI